MAPVYPIGIKLGKLGVNPLVAISLVSEHCDGHTKIEN